MSKEAKFHKLIESQDVEEKKRAWETLQAKLAEETEVPLPQPKKRKLSWVKLTSVIASFVIILAGVLTYILLPKNNMRYCSSSDYTETIVTQTIKDYATETGESILYLDWYDLTGGTLSNKLFKLNDTEEIICIYEEIEDFNTGSLIKIYVIKKDIVIDGLQVSTDKISTIKENSIRWTYSEQAQSADANFSINNYNYYIKVEYPFGEQYILDIVEEMLPN